MAAPTGDRDGRPTVRRLMITQLVLENFKSYAGVQKIGPFHKKFSAIVGPNGSGKSNVIDAMLFVFGKKAKQIRLDKIASLVHKSDTHPNLREAKVTVYFQEIIDYEDAEDEFEMVLGTELTVARAATTSGGSTYYMNNRKSSYQEVTTLLKGKGIDLDHNRFLILQGEVEQISLMKPKGVGENEDGLLEYIEDCVGTQHYKPKIDSAAATVDRLTEERETHVNRVQTAEKDRDALEGAKREAEEFLRKEMKMLKCRAAFVQLTIEARKEEGEEKAKELKKIQAKMDGEQAKTVKCKDELATLEVDFNTAKRAFKAAEKAFDKAKADYSRLDTAAAERDQSRTHAKQQLDKATSVQQKAQAEVTKTENQIKAAEKELQSGKKELQTVRARVEKDGQDVEEKNEAYRQQLKPLREKLDALQKEIIPFNEALTREQQRLEILETERKGERGATEDLAARLSDEQQRRASLGAKVNDMKASIVKDRKTLKVQEDNLKKELERLRKSETAVPAVRANEEKLLASVEELKRQMQEVGGEGQVAKALKRLKQQGGLDGYFGRLGDLGRIDDKYAVAVSTASGGFLDCQVVDTEKTAIKIVEYLKENEIGRATIVIMDKMMETVGQRHIEEFRGPGGLPRLFDLITPIEDAFAPAFYNAVRDTLVADDIDQATAVAFGPSGQGGARKIHRIVTVQGELIDNTGTMAGGGGPSKNAQRGMKNYVVSSESQEQLQKTLKEKDAKLQQCHQDSKRLDAAIHDLKDKINTLSHQVKELAITIESRERDVVELSDNLQNIDGAIKTLEAGLAKQKEEQKAKAARMKEIDKEIKAVEKDIETARFNKKEHDDQLALLQKQIDDVGGADFAKLKAALKVNKDRIRELEKKVSAAEATVKAGNKSIGARRQKLETAEADADKAKEKFKSLDCEDENEDEAIAEAKGKVQTIKKDIDKSRGSLSALERKKDKAKAALNQLKQDEVRLRHDLEGKKGECERLNGQVTKLSGTLEEMDVQARKVIDEYGTCVLAPEDVDDPTTFDSKDFTVKMGEAELSTQDPSRLRHEIQKLEQLQQSVKPNVKALAEWNEKNKILMARSKELKEVSEKRAAAQNEAELLRKARHDEFMTGFRGITHKLKEMYQMLTLGGDAELELVDSFDPFTEGLQFCVRPPKKSWKHISNLSGGEKTLSSLALVFALHHFKPSPLYVMDEIDAALDFKNVSIVGNYVKSSARNAQFIIISLRNNMFDLANRWMGIYKTDNCTKSAALQPFIEPTAAVTAPATPAPAAASGPPEEGSRKRPLSTPTDRSPKRTKMEMP